MIEEDAMSEEDMMNREEAFLLLTDAFGSLSARKQANLLDAALSGRPIACGRHSGVFVTSKGWG